MLATAKQTTNLPYSRREHLGVNSARVSGGHYNLQNGRSRTARRSIPGLGRQARCPRGAWRTKLWARSHSHRLGHR
jgi:hypothetical protein